MPNAVNSIDAMELVSLYEDGMSVAELCRLYGVRPFTAQRLLRENGVKLRGTSEAHFAAEARKDRMEHPVTEDVMGLDPAIAEAAAAIRKTWSRRKRESRRVHKVRWRVPVAATVLSSRGKLQFKVRNGD